MKRISTESIYDGTQRSSRHIRVTGSRQARSTTIYVIPEGQEARQVQSGPMVPGPWGFAIQHATVIDNHGGSAAERDRMTVEIAVGEPLAIEGLPGTWMLMDRDPRKVEGDGVKLVPHDPLGPAHHKLLIDIADAQRRLDVTHDRCCRLAGELAVARAEAPDIEHGDIEGWLGRAREDRDCYQAALDALRATARLMENVSPEVKVTVMAQIEITIPEGVMTLADDEVTPADLAASSLRTLLSAHGMGVRTLATVVPS